ncbi:IS6 family transposase [Cupriavidus metallidurans]|uniref:IS6 family transposase n=1 Tax=Cupriavidus metallidurans TaxID=119219 RepID=UPI001CCA3AA6|nr:IS6 family transposase [Cupriavidus metallidurans]UBM07919.1 IS6 family transposase [Cupriavidus metallidurans]
MLTCVRWYVAYPLSLRHLEQMMAERGISEEHSTVPLWALKLLPALNKVFRRHKRPVGQSWRMGEAYIRVRGQWKYLYRAVDKAGHTINFLLHAQRDKPARRFFEAATAQHGQPDTVLSMAVRPTWQPCTTPTQGRGLSSSRGKLNLEQHRRVGPSGHQAADSRMLGFKDSRRARILLGGMELMHMLAEGQMQRPEGSYRSAAEQLHSLAT